MVVGTLELEIFIPGSNSLKDKRQVVTSLRNKVRARFNVAVAEIDFQDKWQRAVLGMATVNSCGGEIEAVFQKIKEVFEENGDCFITSERKRIFQTEVD
ncbi:MAG TPA: DUF503 domain-containing protein [bacterium]|nr:DUF503 domain-containing protein [bacterium]HOL66049.1 DUF503 domain-containing protein [bacterium]HPP12182.1 DUF503 domain-containing protein [bacterium]